MKVAACASMLIGDTSESATRPAHDFVLAHMEWRFVSVKELFSG